MFLWNAGDASGGGTFARAVRGKIHAHLCTVWYHDAHASVQRAQSEAREAREASVMYEVHY
jgi:hypothetical protein